MDVTRKCKFNGAVITLHDRRNEPCIEGTDIWWRGLSWELECESHGVTNDYHTKHEALADMAHPDNWCIGCAEGFEVDVE